MLRGSPHQVTPVITSDVYFTDETEFGQYLEGAIDSYQPDAGILPVYLLIYFRRCQVLVAVDNRAEYYTPLRSYLITPLPQYALNPFP